MKEKRKEVEIESQRKVVESSEREVNQWLERAGWDKYLVDVEVKKLFECVAAPDKETEPELWMIWRGIDCIVQEYY